MVSNCRLIPHASSMASDSVAPYTSEQEQEQEQEQKQGRRRRRRRRRHLVRVPASIASTCSGAEPAGVSGSASASITLGLQHSSAVVAPACLACERAPQTYGVRPEAAIPTTTSRDDTGPPTSGQAPRAKISASPPSKLSSAPSTALNIACSPPAIRPCTIAASQPNVGGHSAACTAASEPVHVDSQRDSSITSD